MDEVLTQLSHVLSTEFAHNMSRRAGTSERSHTGLARAHTKCSSVLMQRAFGAYQYLNGYCANEATSSRLRFRVPDTVQRRLASDPGGSGQIFTMGWI